MTLVQNKKIYLNYGFTETFEAGLKLRGNEAKAIRNSQSQIDGAKVIIRGGEAFLVGISISPYQNQNKLISSNKKSEDNIKVIKLLLNKFEIIKLATKVEKGFQLVPEKIYDKHGMIKVSIAVAKRKNKHDKRETIKKKDLKRDLE